MRRRRDCTCFRAAHVDAGAPAASTVAKALQRRLNTTGQTTVRSVGMPSIAYWRTSSGTPSLETLRVTSTRTPGSPFESMANVCGSRIWPGMDRVPCQNVRPPSAEVTATASASAGGENAPSAVSSMLSSRTTAPSGVTVVRQEDAARATNPTTRSGHATRIALAALTAASRNGIRCPSYGIEGRRSRARRW